MRDTPASAPLNVSFVIAVLNERERLPLVVESIHAQRGFEGRVEIIVADGGSTDGTREYAVESGCILVHNDVRRCEPGIALGMQAASGDVIFTMAADNPLYDENFLCEITAPFADPDVEAAVPAVVATYDDPWTVHYINAFTDPFNHFVYWNAASPLTYRWEYTPLRTVATYAVYDFRGAQPPLLALAQGFAVRRGFARLTGSEEDDIVPVEHLIDRGAHIAIVPGAKITHHTASGYGDFIRKFEGRIRDRFLDRSMPVWHREKGRSFGRRVRKAIWPFYALSFVAPIAVACYGLLRDRRVEWLLHPFLSFGLGLCVWKQYLLTRLTQLKGRRFGRA
jgi:glycosyltransferase involved in cell wall biosynthesis